MSARSRKQTIQTTIETRDYDSSAPLNEFDLAPLTLVLRNVQGLERRPLVVLRQDVQTASVVRVGARHAEWRARPSLQLTRPTAGPTGCASTTVRDTGGPRMDAPRRSDPSRVHRRIRHGSPRAEATRRASITVRDTEGPRLRAPDRQDPTSVHRRTRQGPRETLDPRCSVQHRT